MLISDAASLYLISIDILNQKTKPPKESSPPELPERLRKDLLASSVVVTVLAQAVLPGMLQELLESQLVLLLLLCLPRLLLLHLLRNLLLD